MGLACEQAAQAKIQRIRLSCAKLVQSLRCLGHNLKVSVQQDAASFVRRMYSQARSEGPSSLHRLLRSVLKTGRRYKAPQLAPCIKIGCDVLTDPSEARIALGRHFAAAEKAVEVSLQTIHCSGQVMPRDDFVDVAGMPSIPQVAAAFSAMKGRRAPGISGIPADVFKQSPVAAARMHMPLYLKSLARGRAPTLWRGFLAAAVPKVGRPSNSLSGYRSVALLEPAFKALTRAMRSELEKAIDKVAPAGMSGGRKGQPMSISAMTVQAHIAKLRRLNKSGAIIFIDGVSAFYATAREYLLREENDSGIQAWIDNVPIRPSLKERVVLLLQGPALLEKLDVPGSPLADILFQIVMTVVLDSMFELLEEAGLCVSLPKQHCFEAVRGTIPTWLDDIAVLVETCDARLLATKVATAAAIAHDCLHTIGIGMNFEKGKSEAVHHWAGKGAKGEQHRVLVEDRAVIEVPLQNGVAHLRCVRNYVHLGTTVTSETHSADDIRRRKRLTEASFGPCYRRLLFNPWLGNEEKVRLFQSLVLSKLCHGAGVWQLCTKSAIAEYCTAYNSFVRRAVRPLIGISCKLLSDDETCALVGVLTAIDALHVARVRQLAQIVDSKSKFVWGTLVSAKSWLDDAAIAVDRVAEITGQYVFPRIEAEAGSRFLWFESVVLKGHACRAILQKFCRSCLWKAREVAQHAFARAKLYHKLERQGGLVLAVAEQKQGQTVGGLLCDRCDVVFADARAFASHRSNKHAETSQASLAAFGTTCERCCKQYWTVERAREHFRKAPICRNVHVQADCGSPVVVDAGPHDWLPVTRLCGPQPWWATLLPKFGGETSMPVIISRSLGSGLQEVTNAAKGQSLLSWWKRWLPGKSEHEISEQFESVPVGALTGIPAQVLSIAAYIAQTADGTSQGHHVFRRGCTCIAVPQAVVLQASDEELALLR